MASTTSFAKTRLAELNPDGFGSLADAFESACRRYADRDAFACMGQTLSFTELEKLSRDFAAYLHNDAGLSPGDRIAIQLPNIPQYPIVAWGALRAGLTLVNTNPLYTARELLHQFNDSGAVALVVLSDLLPAAERVLPDTGIAKVVVANPRDIFQPQPLPQTTIAGAITLPDALTRGGDGELPPVSLTMDDIAVLQYTGGTTGVAKGAVLTHGNVFAGSRQASAAFEEFDVERDIIISPMPLYHIYGFAMNVVGVLLKGGLSVLVPDPRDIDSLIETMKSYPFTGMASVNTLLNAMLQHPDFDSIDFSHATAVIAGGAALVEEIANQWRERTGTDVYEGYGLSETTAALSVNTPSNRRLGTVGPPMLATEVKIVDGDGNTVPDGTEGELLVRGPQVMQGYWQRPEATAESFDEAGWFRTGDIAVIGEDGYISIVDRLKDMVLVSGFNVYPNEVEGVIYTHPDIVECAVVGVPDEKSGEAVKVFAVSSNPELTDKELIDFCRSGLTAYKVPKFVEFRSELPKSNVGKILRRELRS